MRLHLPAHRQIFAAFAIYAFAMGNFFPRLPDIKAALAVGEGTLGLALIGHAVGTLIALTVGAPLLERLGYRRVLLVGTPLLAMFFALATLATTPFLLFLLLIPAGLMIGSIEVVINVDADRIEANADRRIMSRCHAFWSIGFGIAGLFGALMARIGISPTAHLMLVVGLTLLGLVVFLSGFQPTTARNTDSTETPPTFAAPTGAIMVLVAVSLSAMLMEGAYIDWSAIYMTNVFAAPAFIGGLAFAIGAFSQAAVRYFADAIVDRTSPARVAQVLNGGMALGVVCLVFAPIPAVSLLGFALLGAGASALFPLAMSAAAQRTDRPAVINVAALAQFSFMAFLIGPPLLGMVGEHFGMRLTFALGLPFILLSFVASKALGTKPADQTKTT